MTATLERADASAVPQAWRTRILPPTNGRDGWLATLAVGLLAGVLRLVRLDIPRGRIFDEIYYACDAQNLLRYGVEAGTAGGQDCVPNGEAGFVVHPPLGKWAIGLGMRLFGVNEFGWRVAAAVAGTLMVVVLVRVTRRMTGSTVLACLAGLLLALTACTSCRAASRCSTSSSRWWVLCAFACLVATATPCGDGFAVTDDEDLGRLGPGPRLAARGASPPGCASVRPSPPSGGDHRKPGQCLDDADPAQPQHSAEPRLQYQRGHQFRQWRSAARGALRRQLQQ
jgi:hypothetical protein